MPSDGECGGWRVSRGKALSHATRYLVVLMRVGGQQPARRQSLLYCHELHVAAPSSF